MHVIVGDLMLFQDTSVRGIVYELHGVVLDQLAHIVDIVGGLRFKNAHRSVGQEKHIDRICVRIEFVVQFHFAGKRGAADPAL